MDSEIADRKSDLLKFHLEDGETLTARPGVLASRSSNIEVVTETGGGLTSAVKRQVVGGGDAFMNTFISDGDGELWIAPPLPSEITSIEVSDERIHIVSDSLLSVVGDVEIDSEIQDKRNFFTTSDFMMLTLSGTGTAYISGFGGVERRDLEAESFEVALGHVAAYEDTLDIDVGSVGGLKTTLVGGEEKFATLSGEGSVWVQYRSPPSLNNWVDPEESSLMESLRD